MLIRLPGGSVIAIDGRETAPDAATRDMFRRDGKPDPVLSQAGALAAGVPGALAAYDHAARHYGKMPLPTHLTVAAPLARNGFNLTRTYARRLAETAEELGRFEASRFIFLKPDGAVYREGDLLTQADLAKTYEAIAEGGMGWFYQGTFAERTGDWMKTHGGLMTAGDFRSYQVKLREPIRTTYRAHEIVGFPPPSSGGVHLAQVLNILQPFDLKSMGAGSADFIHVVTEALKLAFADRAHWLGDSDFVPVPRGLVSSAYAAKLAQRIDLKRASAVPRHDLPEQAGDDLFGKHTTHFSVADAAGIWVACTATLNTSFGSKAVVPGTGVLLNNQMDDFAIAPGTTNYFGLVGGDANAVAPGKRPLSSMSPTFVLQDGRPVLSVGAAGGPTIISQTLLTILYTVDFGMSPSEALAQPRFHHQWQPDELRIEKAVKPRILRELERRGHKLKVVASLGATQAVGWDARQRGFVGASDPRGEGRASSY
jgi:gamma-glutamyltranspeptidase/glutathione hydrolase